jgi:hypothetical protein
MTSSNDLPPPSTPGSSGSPGEARALRVLIEQLRDEPTPHIDFDRIERSMMAQLDGESRQTPRPRAGVSRYAFAGVIALAVAAGAMFMFRDKGSLLNSPRGSMAQQVRAIDAISADQRVNHPGIGSWVAERGAKVRVVEDSADRVVLALDEGALIAEVIPRPIPDRFVVIAGHTRVAVRGTIFRVAREGDHVDVSVTRGVVAVGPEGASSGVSLVAPRSGVFDLEGKLRGETTVVVPTLNNPLLSGTDAGSNGTHPIDAVDTTASANAGNDSASQAKVDTSLSVSSTRGAASASTKQTWTDEANLQARHASIAADCFRREAHLPSGVNVTATTTLVVTFDANHRVTGSSFRSPLAPAVEQCIVAAVASEKGPTGTFETPLRLVTGD